MSALDFCQISGACFYKIALITLGVYFKRIKNPSFHSTWCTSFQIEGARLPYFRAWVHLKSMLRILKTSLGSPEKYAQKILRISIKVFQIISQRTNVHLTHFCTMFPFYIPFQGVWIGNSQKWVNVEGNICRRQWVKRLQCNCLNHKQVSKMEENTPML